MVALSLRNKKHRKAGFRPSKVLLRKLHRLFPTVKLQWHANIQRWVMWELGKESRIWWWVKKIEGPNGEFIRPNYANTIGWLRANKVPAISSEWALDRWIDSEVEGPNRELEEKIEAPHREQMRDGHRAMHDLAKQKKSFQVPK